MKLFISWSGEFSKRVAERLSVWIQIIIQSVEVFYSPEDIEKGENWGNRLSEELERSNFGIICLTPENVLAPWIHFEAGALSKITGSRVSAIMLGIAPSDIKGPLARLQNTACTREDLFCLFQSINNSSETPLRPEILKNAFDNSWENLIRDIEPIIKEHTSHTPALKAEKDNHEDSDSYAIQEILRLMRSLDNKLRTPSALPVAGSSSDLDDPLRILDKRSRITMVYCPEEYIDDVMPIIRRYISSSSPEDIKRIHRNLRIYHTSHILIPAHMQHAFTLELKKVSPQIEIYI